MRTRKIRLRMGPVELDARFGHLAQVVGIRPVVYDGEMRLRPPGLVAFEKGKSGNPLPKASRPGA
jgi:hypothetical protein